MPEILWSLLWTLSFAAIGIFVFGNCIVYVDHDHRAVVGRVGRKPRVLAPGFNFVSFPLEKIIYYHWTIRLENEKGASYLHRVKGYAIDTRIKSLDVLPMKGYDVDRVEISLNGYVEYQIVDPAKAVTSTDDLLSHLNSALEHCTQVYLARWKCNDILGQNELVSADVTKEIGAKFDPDTYGIKCVRYFVQSIGVSKAILERAETLKRLEHDTITEKTRRDVESASKTHGFELEKLRLQERSALDERLTDNQLARARAHLEVKRAEMEVERVEQETKRIGHAFEQQAKISYVESLVKAGFSPAEINNHLAIPHLSEAVGKSCKMIISNGPADLASMLLMNTVLGHRQPQ
jgi:regulator of protease activity HflC (stomatin/prohibitin superfamily)